MNIAVTGGGTGGHLIIAKTLAIRLNELGHNVIFIGSSYGQDKLWFENADFFSKKYFLHSSGVVNKKGIKKISSLFNILNLSLSCKKFFKENKIDFVISVGGYSSAPAGICAIINKIPLFIHEQNAIMGRLNKILKPFSKGFYSSYYEPKFNYLIDDKFFKLSRDREKLNTILFLGGSQGAVFINDLALSIAKKLNENNIKISHQCGTKDYDRIKSEYQKLGINADLFAFSNEIEKKMANADLCISRSGASSLWELCANRLPTIFVPYKFAANNHQFYNAKFLLDHNLAKIINQDDIKNTSKNLKNLVSKSGVDEILDDIFKKVKNENV